MTGRHAWIDATAGVAGDMLLAALLDAGAELAAVQRSIDAVLPDAVRVVPSAVTRAGLRATRVEVRLLAPDPTPRPWASIRSLLVDAPLAEPVRRDALAVFARLAAAESAVHGVPVGDVHFHEVGGHDAIADVVGVCAAWPELGVATISASAVAVGAGRVGGAHGELPVPVPAVLELARGWRVRAGGTGELATPTGMALVTALAARCEDLPALEVAGVGVGAGAADPAGRPNVTRVVLGRPVAEPAAGEQLVLLEANVDDLDPRLWPGVLDGLLGAGAADAWLTPIVMKKGRPAHTLAVLARPDRVAGLRDRMFTATSTFGVRETRLDRSALARCWVDVLVGEVSIPVKIAHRDRVVVTATPEFEPVAAAAAAQGRPPRDVLAAAAAAAVAAGLTPGAPVPAAARPVP